MAKRKKSIFEKILISFQAEAIKLGAIFQATSILKLGADLGVVRESSLMEFLSRHLPRRCGIINGGFIFDSEGNISKQIDIIITNDLALQFQQNNAFGMKGYCNIEACYAVISVKSDLKPTELVKDLNGFASIPPMPPLKIDTSIEADKLIERLPYKIIFAYIGRSAKTLVKYTEDFYEKRNIPAEEAVDFIIVNNKYLIEKLVDDTVLADGTKALPFSYGLRENSDFIGGFSLWKIISEIQLAANLGSHMILEYDKYTDKLLDTFS